MPEIAAHVCSLPHTLQHCNMQSTLLGLHMYNLQNKWLLTIYIRTTICHWQVTDNGAWQLNPLCGKGVWDLWEEKWSTHSNSTSGPKAFDCLHTSTCHLQMAGTWAFWIMSMHTLMPIFRYGYTTSWITKHLVGQKSYKVNLVIAHFKHDKKDHLNPTQGIKITGWVE